MLGFPEILPTAKRQNPPRCPSMKEWMKKLEDFYTVEYYSVIKRNEILLLSAAWLELEDITLSEISQTQKDRYPCSHLLCGS